MSPASKMTATSCHLETAPADFYKHPEGIRSNIQNLSKKMKDFTTISVFISAEVFTNTDLLAFLQKKHSAEIQI
jgi:hypothetical protein